VSGGKTSVPPDKTIASPVLANASRASFNELGRKYKGAPRTQRHDRPPGLARKANRLVLQRRWKFVKLASNVLGKSLVSCR
jgi:hypothetical protein